MFGLMNSISESRFFQNNVVNLSITEKKYKKEMDTDYTEKFDTH